MHEEPHSLGAFVSYFELALAPIGRYCPRDRIVEAPVERVKIIGADRCVLLSSKLGHYLTYVAITVHDLRDGEAVAEQLLAVQRGTLRDTQIRRGSADQMQRIVRRHHGQ